MIWELLFSRNLCAEWKSVSAIHNQKYIHFVSAKIIVYLRFILKPYKRKESF